jgi:hypothetical protein
LPACAGREKSRAPGTKALASAEITNASFDQRFARKPMLE